MGTTITSLPSFLFNDSSSSSPVSKLLSLLAGGGTQGAGGSFVNGASAISALQQAETNKAKDIADTAKQPQVQRDIQAFTKAIQSATTPQQLLSNPDALKVLLTANGLGDQLQYTALAKKALLSDSGDSKSLANTLSDTRWKSVAQTYDFANKGLSVIKDPNVIQTITNAYAEITWRHSLDATTPGLSDALTFRQTAGSVTVADQILGDPILRRVVTTTLGLPLQIALQPLDAQERDITSKLDLSKLQDPRFVEQFAQRYLIAAANNSQTSTNSTTSLTALAVRAQGLVV